MIKKKLVGKMRELSFNGYLEQYIKDISGDNSLSVSKLVKKAKKNYRIIDPLILYCALTNRKELFNKYTRNKYKELIENLTVDNFLNDEYQNYSFSKIWDSYQHRSNIVDYNNAIKSRIRVNILKMMKEKNITNYRVYTDLDLNPGNINAFLTNGDTSKASLNLVKKIYNYVNS